MNKENKELIEELFNKNYGWIELEELSEDIKEWIEEDKKRF
jgi:hypothetical protein